MKKYKGIKTLEVLEGADNYNEWIASRLRPFIVPPALEIGAGIGNISSQFKDIKDLTITDIDPKLVKKLSENLGIQKNIKTKTFDIASNMHTAKPYYKTVYSVNVLEHIKDDMKALKNMNMLLVKKGKIVLLVPAKKYAFNNLDKKLGHCRRYEKQELRQKLEDANFKVDFLEYFNLLGLLSWMVREKISGNSHELKPYQVKIFDLIVPILKKIEPDKRLPLGISLIACGEKR